MHASNHPSNHPTHPAMHHYYYSVTLCVSKYLQLLPHQRNFASSSSYLQICWSRVSQVFPHPLKMMMMMIISSTNPVLAVLSSFLLRTSGSFLFQSGS
jgi:hypothetical protein